MSKDLFASHRKKVSEISAVVKAWNLNNSNMKKRELKIYHGSTHSTRKKQGGEYIDIISLNRVISIDPEEKTAVAESNVSMDALISETLRHGLIPQVVTEFPGITVGGAIQGAALESSSFKFGQFNAAALEYEVITGQGEIIVCSKTKNQDLFYGMTGSYGTLGLLMSVKLQLIQARKFIKLLYLRVDSFNQAIEKINACSRDCDYIDAIMFSSTKGVVMVGKSVDCGEEKIQSFAGAIDPWFYNHAQELTEKYSVYSELIPVRDYVFRYNRGAFWMGDYFFKIMKIPGNRVFKTIFNPFLNTRKLYEVLHSMGWTQRFFIQDIYFPINKVEQYLQFVNDRLAIYPIWLCPITNTHDPEKLSPNYSDEDALVNVGVWGALPTGSNYIQTNRDMEALTEDLGGRKMLYAQNFYSENVFWRIYECEWYKQLRAKYHADEIFPDIYKKISVEARPQGTPFTGFLKLLWSFFTLKNINS